MHEDIIECGAEAKQVGHTDRGSCNPEVRSTRLGHQSVIFFGQRGKTFPSERAGYGEKPQFAKYFNGLWMQSIRSADLFELARHGMSVTEQGGSGDEPLRDARCRRDREPTACIQ